MKTAYERALERLEAQGIEKPKEGLSAELQAQAGEIRSKAKAELAQLEILHRDRLTRLADPEARQREQEEYLRERARIEERQERQIRKLRES